MAKPSLDEIRIRVRKVIAADKGYGQDEIHDGDSLRKDLNYNDTGLKALTPDINDEFFVAGKGLSIKQVQGCGKVSDIADKVDEQPIEDFN